MRKSNYKIFIIVAVILLVVMALILISNEYVPILMENHQGVLNKDGMMMKFGGLGTTILFFNDGYSDYKAGDILLISTTGQPFIGSMVYYNYFEDDRLVGHFGPYYGIKKIVGLPGDTVIFDFNKEIYEVRNKQFPIEERVTSQGEILIIPRSINRLLWGKDTYMISDYIGKDKQLVINVPEDEYLTDALVGHNVTIKTKAIQGIVVLKIGHSFSFEKRAYWTIY